MRNWPGESVGSVASAGLWFNPLHAVTFGLRFELTSSCGAHRSSQRCASPAAH